MKRLPASLARACAGFALSVLAALSVVVWKGAAAPGGGAAELAGPASAFGSRLLALAPPLLPLALLGFAAGLVPAALLRAAVPRPLAAGAGAGLFWVALAIAGAPYSLGLTAPAGILIVSAFLAVFVSAASIGAALSRGAIGGEAGSARADDGASRGASRETGS